MRGAELLLVFPVLLPILYSSEDKLIRKWQDGDFRQGLRFKSISTVASLLHRFKTFTDTLSKDQQLWEKFSLPVLAEFAFAVGQGGILTMGRRCYRFSYQSSSGSEINGQPYHICCGSTRQVVSSRDPLHVTRVYRSTPPQQT